MNIIKAIETHANGATWMCDLGQLKLVEIKNFWMPPHKQNKDTEQSAEAAQKETSEQAHAKETVRNQVKETG